MKEGKRNHLDRWLELLNDSGVGYQARQTATGFKIELKEGMAKVKGYNFFYTDIQFDKEGELQWIGAYE